jgi:peroxiredoxin
MVEAPTGAVAMARVRVLQFAFVVSLALVVILGARTNALRRELRRASFQLQMPRAGDLVPAFRTATLAGDTVTVGAPAGANRQVLFAFNARCPLCLESFREWNALDSAIHVHRLAAMAVGLSLDSLSATRANVAERGVRFGVVLFPERMRRLYRVPGVPITLVVDSSGELLYVRGGVVTGSVRDSVLAFLKG